MVPVVLNANGVQTEVLAWNVMSRIIMKLFLEPVNANRRLLNLETVPAPRTRPEPRVMPNL